MPLLRKLIGVLPYLEQHRIVERNAQRRGVQVLEKALQHLAPDDVAEILPAMMDSVSALSKQFSMRKLKAATPETLRHEFRHYPLTSFVMGETTSCLLGFSMWCGAVAQGAVITAASAGFLAIPLVIGGGAFATAKYLGIEKQVQGTALYMIGQQLEKLKRNWDQVTPDNRKKLCESFDQMHKNIDRLDGVKSATLKRFFNDQFINPSTFDAHSNAFSEACRRIGHSVSVPWTSRRQSLPPPPTPEEKKLYHNIERYFEEARTAGMDKWVPENFLENLRRHIPKKEYGHAVAVLNTCFGRVRGGGRGPMADPMTEYANPLTKGKTLEKIVAMATLLANGTAEDVQGFVNVALLAEADCHNNVRQIFQQLWEAVLIDKVKKGEVRRKTEYGEVEIDAGEGLLRVGMALFREQELARAIFDVCGNESNVEEGLAITIALGTELGLLDPVEGMGYDHVANAKVTNFALLKIKNKFLERVREQESILTFLKEWNPLTDWVKGAQKTSEKIAEEEFEKAQDEYFDIEGKPTEDQEKAFNEAAAKYKVVVGAVVETGILALLAQYPEAKKFKGVEDLVFLSGKGKPYTSLSVDLDDSKWLSFVTAMENIIGEGEVGTAALAQVHHDFRLQHVPQDTTATNSPINIEHLPFPVEDKGAGGDCLFYALGVPRGKIANIRAELAAAISARVDDEFARNRNANYVVAALSQTPAVEHLAASLTFGRHAVPNSVYAQMVATSGIYAGPEELGVWTTLPDNQLKTALVVSAGGGLYRIRNGHEKRIHYTPENKATILKDAIEGADIALYQTSNHWQAIVKAQGRKQRRRHSL